MLEATLAQIKDGPYYSRQMNIIFRRGQVMKIFTLGPEYASAFWNKIYLKGGKRKYSVPSKTHYLIGVASEKSLPRSPLPF